MSVSVKSEYEILQVLIIRITKKQVLSQEEIKQILILMYVIRIT